MKTALAFTAAILMIPILFYAAAGVACLHFTAPIVTNEQECDKVQDGWCMNRMNDGLTHYEDGTMTLDGTIEKPMTAQELQPTVSATQLNQAKEQR